MKKKIILLFLFLYTPLYSQIKTGIICAPFSIYNQKKDESYIAVPGEIGFYLSYEKLNSNFGYSFSVGYKENEAILNKVFFEGAVKNIIYSNSILQVQGEFASDIGVFSVPAITFSESLRLFVKFSKLKDLEIGAGVELMISPFYEWHEKKLFVNYPLFLGYKFII